MPSCVERPKSVRSWLTKGERVARTAGCRIYDARSRALVAVASLLVALAGCSDSPQPAETTHPDVPPPAASERTVTIYGTCDVQGTYLGLQTPEAAIRQALQELPWAVPETLTYDESTKGFRFNDCERRPRVQDLGQTLRRFGYGMASSQRKPLPSPETIVVVEVGRTPCPWTSPAAVVDLRRGINVPAGFPQGASSEHEGGVFALFADGSVRFLSENMDVTTLRALCTMAGNEAVDDRDF